MSFFLSLIAALIAAPAAAQEGVPVTLVPQVASVQSFDCSGGVNRILPGVLAIGASENCMQFPGMVRIVNKTGACVALSVGSAPLQTQMPFMGGSVVVGILDGGGGFRSCLPPGDTALFFGPAGGSRLTGVAYASGTRTAAQGSLVAGAPQWVVNSTSDLGDGTSAILAASTWGTCGNGNTLSTDPRKGAYSLNLEPQHCR